MKFLDELYLGKNIANASSAVEMLKAGDRPAGIFCVCKRTGGRFLYEILSSAELGKTMDSDVYTIYGIAAGKQGAFELLRYIVEDRNEY